MVKPGPYYSLITAPSWGYLTSTTNSKEQSNPVPKVRLPPIEPISIYELYDMLNDLAQQHVFKNAIELMGNNYDLLSCWWHFDHCVNTAIRLDIEVESQWTTHQEPLWEVKTSQNWWEILTDYDRRMWTGILGDEGTPRSIGQRTIWNLWVYPSFGIFIPSTIMINITCCSHHHIQLWRIICNCSQYSRTTWEWRRITTTSYSTTLDASSCLFFTIIMVSHIIIDITQNQFMLWEAVQMTRIGAPDHLLSHYESLINEHNAHHMNKKGTHSKKCGSGLPFSVWRLG